MIVGIGLNEQKLKQDLKICLNSGHEVQILILIEIVDLLPEIHFSRLMQ